MIVPFEIEQALLKRAEAAEDFAVADYTVAKFLDEHNIIVEEYDIHMGCESLVNPFSSIDRILDAIKEHKDES